MKFHARATQLVLHQTYQQWSLHAALQMQDKKIFKKAITKGNHRVRHTYLSTSLMIWKNVSTRMQVDEEKLAMKREKTKKTLTRIVKHITHVALSKSVFDSIVVCFFPPHQSDTYTHIPIVVCSFQKVKDGTSGVKAFAMKKKLNTCKKESWCNGNINSCVLVCYIGIV